MFASPGNADIPKAPATFLLIRGASEEFTVRVMSDFQEKFHSLRTARVARPDMAA
jgi:hypothetical protein